MDQVWARVPGSCGELIQGIVDGQLVHVTFPIPIYGMVTVSLKSGAKSNSLAGVKLKEAVRLTYKLFGGEVARTIEIAMQDNPLPLGKGMASSTVDICAGIVATAKACGATLSLKQIADLALKIEPTDGVFIPGIAVFAHRTGAVCEQIGSPLPMSVTILDAGGEFDTVLFNSRNDLPKLNQANAVQIQRAFDLLVKGFRQADMALVGQAATSSAIANQTILCKPFLEEIIEIVHRYGGYGVNVAHSGSVIGLLFPLESEAMVVATEVILQRYPVYRKVLVTQMGSGGITWGNS